MRLAAVAAPALALLAIAVSSGLALKENDAASSEEEEWAGTANAAEGEGADAAEGDERRGGGGCSCGHQRHRHRQRLRHRQHHLSHTQFDQEEMMETERKKLRRVPRGADAGAGALAGAMAGAMAGAVAGAVAEPGLEPGAREGFQGLQGHRTGISSGTGFTGNFFGQASAQRPYGPFGIPRPGPRGQAGFIDIGGGLRRGHDSVGRGGVGGAIHTAREGDEGGHSKSFGRPIGANKARRSWSLDDDDDGGDGGLVFGKSHPGYRDSPSLALQGQGQGQGLDGDISQRRPCSEDIYRVRWWLSRLLLRVQDALAEGPGSGAGAL